MIITQLRLENFGIFRGQVSIDLKPRQFLDETPPVILFGGKNGAGKTTILEAIRLCLYGRSALGSRVRKFDYENYLRERVHRPHDNTIINYASIEIEFEFIHAGIRSVYSAHRTWNIETTAVKESVTIYKDGQLFKDIDDTHWNDFLRDLIPPGIANLFFFDGEQIQALADESSEAEALETAIDGLLNINLVDRLRTDLDLYVKHQEQQEQSRLQKQAEELYDQFLRVEQALSEVRQDRAGLNSRLDNLRNRIDIARQVLVQEGASFLHAQSRLEAEQEEVVRELERTKNSIRELASDLFPFAIVPNWNLRLHQHLQEETQIEQDRIALQIRGDTTNLVIGTLERDDFKTRVMPYVSPSDWERLIQEVKILLSSNEPATTSTSLHSLSVQRRQQLIDLIDRSLYFIPKQMEELDSQLIALEDKQRKIALNLRQVPEKELANPLIEEFQRLAEQAGEIVQQINDKDGKIRELELQHAEIERLRKKTWLEIASIGDINLGVERAAKVQLVLEEYKARITHIKLEELQLRVAEYFNRLCRKQNLVRQVLINPDGYRVSLYTENGELLPKSSLSAGERQLYAMSLLWALRSVSGRYLPIIVDTPMGRLDTDHRHTLLTEFFPNAAHQLILLSTDTEIGVQEYQTLLPSISRTYLLNYDMESHSTDVEEHYFAEFEAMR